MRCRNPGFVADLEDKEMIKVDLSKVVSPRFGLYLLGLIPGVFFELSVAVGNPHSTASLIGSLREIFPFGPYALLLLFVASSLFIGSGFFVAAWIVQLLISLGFQLWRYGIRATFGSQWMYHWFAKMQGMPPRRSVFIRLLSWLIFWARGREVFTEARPVLKCLNAATERLLQERYGIEVNRLLQLDNGEWQVWPPVIGKPLVSLQEGTMAARAFLGCGLAGFTVLYAAPALRGWYFISLCSVFAISGLLSSISLAFWGFNPVRKSLLRLKSVLLALAETTTATEKRKVETEEEGIGATTEANANGRE